MLKLKRYQQRVLDELGEYLQLAVAKGDADLAFYERVRQQYRPISDLPGLPYVCIRLPTGGGKTLVACHSVGITARHYLQQDYPLVLWLVPTNTIREQTLKALRDRRHPYRQVLDADFDGRVTAMDVRDALFLSRSTLEGGTCIVVSTLAALRREDTEGLKAYESNGALMDHFTGLPREVEALLDKLDGQVVYSLANLLRLHRPMVIVDEAHNARTSLSFETLARFNPACIVEFTATPANDSNVLVTASAAQLYDEAMIKLPIKLHAYSNWQQVLEEAIRQRELLEELARQEEATSGEHLRPIVLVQAQPRSRTHDTLTIEVLAKALQEDYKIDESQIAIATGDQREIEGVDLFDPNCPIRFILTVRALAEGWDCSFAYILCSVAQIRSSTAVEQILGRVLRLPYASRKATPELNRAYAYVTSQDFDTTARSLTDALVDNGFERYEADTALEMPTQLDLPLFQYVRRQAPADLGVPFQVPQLTILYDGQRELFEETYLPIQWELAKCDPILSEEEFRSEPPAGAGIEIYLADDETLKHRFIGNLHAQLSLLERTRGWTANELAIWLDHNIPHPDVPQTQSAFFLRRMIDHLVEGRGLDLDQLVRRRFRLRDVAQAKIDHFRQEARRAGFQEALSPEMRPALEVAPQFAFRFPPDSYPANWYYDGRWNWDKHYYLPVGELKDDTEEYECARLIDTLPQVKHWVRNLDRRGFWFQISTQKFYPDFVAELTDGRDLIVEYKGSHLYTSDESKEKRAVGQLWQDLSDGQGIFLMPTRRNYESIHHAIT